MTNYIADDVKYIAERMKELQKEREGETTTPAKDPHKPDNVPEQEQQWDYGY